MNCPRCSNPVERIWTGKKTAVVEPGAVTAYVPIVIEPDVFHKTAGVRVSHKCKAGVLAAVAEEDGAAEEATA